MAINPSNLYTTIVKRPVGTENKIYINIGLQFFDTVGVQNIAVDNDITAELYDESDALIDTFTLVTSPLLVVNVSNVYEYIEYDITAYSGQALTLKVNYAVASVNQPEFIATYQTGAISQATFLVGDNLQKHNNVLYQDAEKTTLLTLTNTEGLKVDATDQECRFILWDTDTNTQVLSQNSVRQNVGVYTSTFTPTALVLGDSDKYQGYFEAKTSAGFVEVSNTREFFTVLSDPSLVASNYGPSLCSVQDVRKVYPNVDSLLSEWRSLDIEQREIFIQNRISIISRYIKLDIKNYREFDVDLLSDYCAMKVVQDFINLSGSRMKTDDQFLRISNREVLRLENIFNENDKGIISRG